MGYRHAKEEILRAATAVALEAGIARLTFAAVGKRLNISDRTVVYYFPTKAALVTAVIETLGSDLESILEAAFGTEPLSAAGLAKRAWPVMTAPAADRVFALYFEIIGLAASGQEPFDGLARALLEGWVAWLAPHTIGSDATTQRAQALSAIAQLDGLLLVRQLLGSDAGEQAAREAGVIG